MMPKKLLLILFFSVLMNPAHAQDNLPAVVDATDVFSDVVEVVETLPLYIADEEQVSFYDYAAEEWNTYPYPDFPVSEGEVARANFNETPQGDYILSVEYDIPCAEDCGEVDEGIYLDYTPPRAAVVRERWHFDPDSGEFTLFEAICGQYAQALPDQGEWVTYSSNLETYLCNTETGQTSAPLPDLARTTPLLNAPSLSANGRWLVFTFYYDLNVFAYDFVEDRLTLLGTMTSTSPFFSRDYPKVNWINDQQIVLENMTSNYGDDHAYLYQADVSQSGSLELIYHSALRPALRLEAPIRYVWVGRQFDDTTMGEALPPPEEDCVIHEYNPLDGEITSSFISNVCSYGMTIPDGSGDRLAVRYPYNENEKYLVRFNLVTGTSEEIYVGSYEQLMLSSVSADGHYAIMTVDSGNYNYRLAVIDLQATTLLEPFYSVNDQYFYVYWISDHIFWRNLPSPSPNNEFYSISDTHLAVQPTIYTPIFRGLYDHQFLLVANSNTLGILKIETLETITIAQVSSDARMSVVWNDDGLLTIRVLREGETFGRWRVRLNL